MWHIIEVQGRDRAMPCLYIENNYSYKKRDIFLKYATFFASKNLHPYCTFAKSAVNLFISVSETSPEVTTNLKRKVVD